MVKRRKVKMNKMMIKRRKRRETCLYVSGKHFLQYGRTDYCGEKRE
jgi:hypothetical protein